MIESWKYIWYNCNGVRFGRENDEYNSVEWQKFPTWKVQCRMAFMRDGVWGIVAKTEVSPSPDKAEDLAKFVARRDRALATIVLSVDPSLLYLLGDPQDPAVVWEKLTNQFQKKTWANKLALRRKLYSLRFSETHQGNDRDI